MTRVLQETHDVLVCFKILREITVLNCRLLLIIYLDFLTIFMIYEKPLNTFREELGKITS